jgi:hypothetical protein
VTRPRVTGLMCALCAALCLSQASAQQGQQPPPAPPPPEPQQAGLQVLTGTLSFGSVMPMDGPELASSAAQLLVFSPTGDCFVGVVTPGEPSALALVPTGEEPAFSIPLAWELRWGRPGMPWTGWLPPLSPSATGSAPPGLWWRVGTPGDTIPCTAELRCRATFAPLSPPGRYALNQPVGVAAWIDPVGPQGPGQNH